MEPPNVTDVTNAVKLLREIPGRLLTVSDL